MFEINRIRRDFVYCFADVSQPCMYDMWPTAFMVIHVSEIFVMIHTHRRSYNILLLKHFAF